MTEHELIVPEETDDDTEVLSDSVLSRTQSLVNELETMIKPGPAVRAKISPTKTPSQMQEIQPPKDLIPAPAETERLFLYRKAVTLLGGTTFTWTNISKGFQGTNNELYKVEY